jgi:hypothetical protein
LTKTPDPKPVPPTERGLYWAKQKGFKWFNFIVYITGEAPYLKLRYALSRNDDCLNTLTLDDIGEWGPEILTPEGKKVM